MKWSMAYRQVDFALDEYFHCYSRGVDGRKTFNDTRDYERFIELLYACNAATPFRRDLLAAHGHESILKSERQEPLVAIVAYCLMPNHYHIVMRETCEDGISRFMQKLGTAYTMYFNARNERVGSLFIKPFRAKHIRDDDYLKRVVQYVHLNPAELSEPGWKEGRISNVDALISSLRKYRFSSLPDYAGSKRIENVILDSNTIHSLYDSLPSLQYVVAEALAYLKSLR